MSRLSPEEKARVRRACELVLGASDSGTEDVAIDMLAESLQPETLNVTVPLDGRAFAEIRRTFVREMSHAIRTTRAVSFR